MPGCARVCSVCPLPLTPAGSMVKSSLHTASPPVDWPPREGRGDGQTGVCAGRPGQGSQAGAGGQVSYTRNWAFLEKARGWRGLKAGVCSRRRQAVTGRAVWGDWCWVRLVVSPLDFPGQPPQPTSVLLGGAVSVRSGGGPRGLLGVTGTPEFAPGVAGAHPGHMPSAAGRAVASTLSCGQPSASL